VPKTQFKRESFGKSVLPIASFELPVRKQLNIGEKVILRLAKEVLLLGHRQAISVGAFKYVTA
jgi:hypothetical protein